MKECFLEVLFDWVDESRPFFSVCTGGRTKLSEIAAPFISPLYSRNSLKAFIRDKVHIQQVPDLFSFPVYNLPTGTRVVFSFSSSLTR
jgi:hypothetical protein